MESFAKNLRRLRNDAGLTQEQLATACGYSGQSRIANYESGTRTPHLHELPALAAALRSTVADLLGIAEAAEPGIREVAALYRAMTPTQRATWAEVGRTFAESSEPSTISRRT